MPQVTKEHLKRSTTSNFWKIQKDNSSIKNEVAKRKKLLKQSIRGLIRKWNAAENQSYILPLNAM